jgi:endonuclease-8/formamidopyrimidine-DNA glycosylase
MLDARAVGKQLFLGFEGEAWMRVHLGIYGAWDFGRAAGVDVARDSSGSVPLDEAGEDSLASIGAPRKTRLGQTQMRFGEDERARSLDEDWTFPPEPIGQVRVRLLTDDAVADLRGPTACEVLDASEVQAVLNRLGPDPATEQGAAAEQRFVDRARAKRAAIGQVLMDQSVIAGIGNVYRAELLFRAGINPHTPANQLTDAQLHALWLDWAYLLDIGITVGQMMTIDGLEGDAYTEALHKRSARHWVYKREGLPCLRCGTNVALELMANRKLYWCPGCQH